MAVVVRLLGIGNSLTAANDLPAMVKALGRASGVEITCTTIAKPVSAPFTRRVPGRHRTGTAPDRPARDPPPQVELLRRAVALLTVTS